MRVELKDIETNNGVELLAVQQISEDGRKDVGKARCWKDIDSLLAWLRAVKEEVERVHGITI